MTRVFKGEKFLSTPKDNFDMDMDEIDDIGVVEESTTELTMDKKLRKFFNTYNGCYACAGKVLPQSDSLGDCTRC